MLKITELFSKGLNTAAAAEDSCAAEVRRKQKIQLAQVIFTLLLTVSSSVFLTVAYIVGLLNSCKLSVETQYILKCHCFVIIGFKC